MTVAMVHWTLGMQRTTEVRLVFKVRLREGGAQSLPAVTATQANTLFAKRGLHCLTLPLGLTALAPPD